MITEKEIEQAATKYAIQEKSSYSSFVDGANFVLKDMDSEMCLFAEWAEQHYIKSVTVTGKWFDPSGIVAEYFTTSELLQIYKNREK